MSDQPLPPERDHIDELLGSLQKDRSGSETAVPKSPHPWHRRYPWIIPVAVIAVAGIVAAAWLLLTPRTGTINIRSFPAGASIVLDGQPAGSTPAVLTHVAPGTHTIQIRLTNWDDWSGSATVERGTTTQVIANLVHAAYSMTVASTPPGASVTLDGVVKGVTPLTVTGLKPRSYTLIVKLKGYASITRTVNLLDSAQESQIFSLSPAFGKIHITSTPVGAQVFVDDELAGTTPLSLNDFPVGDYALRLTFDGLKEIIDRMTVGEKATFTKDFKFEAPRGGLTITTDPPGASITIDGTLVGSLTPFSVSTLKEGAHQVFLYLDGFLPWSGEVVVVNDQPVTLNVQLTKLQ